MSENYEIPHVPVNDSDKRETIRVPMSKYIDYYERQGVPSWQSLVWHDAEQYRIDR